MVREPIQSRLLLDELNELIPEKKLPPPPVGEADRSGTGNPHLLAARTLARRMRQFRHNDQAQTLAGRAICQHLQALLKEQAPPHH